MSFDQTLLRQIVEGAIIAANKPLTVLQLEALFAEDPVKPSREEIRCALEDIGNELQGRGFELVQVASGFRFQVSQQVADWVGRLWEEKPQKYSRALLETLALIAYRQPITRGEIEEIRGVAVSSNIMRTLLDRDWVRVVGHREVPGRPAMYATTRIFLDYFNLKSLEELPPLSEIKELDSLTNDLELVLADEQIGSDEASTNDTAAADTAAERQKVEAVTDAEAESETGAGDGTGLPSGLAKGTDIEPATPRSDQS